MRPWRNRRLQLVVLMLLWLCSIFIIYWYMTQGDPGTIKNYTPELLWWTDNMHFNYDETRQCGFSRCRVTNNRQRLSESMVILFYASNMKPEEFPIPRLDKHLWAMLHEESPRNVPFVPHDVFLQHFNYTSTFSRHSDMPLTTQYLPQASDLTQLEYHVTHLSKQAFQFNSGLASVVFLQTDCNTMSGREDYVREMMQYIKVDSYGGCLHNRDLPERLQADYLNNLYSPDLLHFLAHYKFMIAIENGVCEDYITEKFWRPLIAGVVPIYFGSPSIRDWQPHNKSAIYVDDFRNARELSYFISHLGDNDTEYMSYLQHKVQRRNAIDNQKLLNHLTTRRYSININQQNDEQSLFHRFECYMCRQIHSKYRFRQANKRHYNCSFPPAHVPLENTLEPTYGADWRAMMSIGRCQAVLLDELLRLNEPYTAKHFDKRLFELTESKKCD